MNFKKLLAAGAAAFGLAAVFSGAALAEEDVITVMVDNENVDFQDQQPIIIGEGHTMVPVRAVFEKAGAEVSWDQPTQTATFVRGDYTVSIKYGEKALYKNGQRVEIATEAIIENDRMLIPVRAIAEAMDFAVTWDGHHSLILVSTSGTPYRAYAFQRNGFKTLEDAAELYSDGSMSDSADLDNDGKAEQIEFNSTPDIDNRTEPVLVIDGEDYTASLGNISNAYSMAVVDINTADDKKEIIVSESEDVLTAHVYRYENGIMTRITDNSSAIQYASKLLFSNSARGLIISDLTGFCFTDIMVTASLYKMTDRKANGKTVSEINLHPITGVEKIYGRNLYKTYDDEMLYRVIYTDNYKPNTYKDVTAGYIGTSELEHFKVLDGYYSAETPKYIELYVELQNGTKAVIIPYSA